MRASGALNCLHTGPSVVVMLLIDTPHDVISEVQLQVYTVAPCPTPPMKYIFSSWNIACLVQQGAGRGLTVYHAFPHNTSTTSKFLPTETHPPATTKASGDLVLIDDVRERLVGIGGSDGCHSSPLSLVNSWLVCL